MKSLEKSFQKIAKRNPYWSSYLCFAKAVTNRQFSKKAILFWFNKLVEKDDYVPKEKRCVVEHLMKLSNSAEEGIKSI